MQHDFAEIDHLWSSQRAIWSLVWLGIIVEGLHSWGLWTSWPGYAFLSPLVIMLGLTGVVAQWLSPRELTARFNHVGFACVLIAIGIAEGVVIGSRQFYATDSAAFNQIAARLLLRGKNPYTTPFRGISNLLHPVAQYWTYLANGGHVAQMSYPAGSFLFQIPLIEIGIRHMSTDWTDLIAWGTAGILLYFLLPSHLRWLSPLLLLSGEFTATFLNGSTDALFMPFLILALWRWDRFATGRAGGVASWIGPIALGVACSIKQTPWFCVPFLVLGVAIEAHRAGVRVAPVVLRYGATVVGVFLAFNAWFIAWSPHAWWRGTVLPLSQPLVADGQGFVALALHGFTGGVDVPLLSYASLICLSGLLGAFWFWYDRLKFLWLFLLPLVLFVPGRSLSSYLLDFFPAALVGALSVHAVVARRRSQRARRLALASLVVPVAAASTLVALAFTSIPLSVRLDSVVTGASPTSGFRYFRYLTVTVHNQTAQSVTPHFMVDLGTTNPTGFWYETVLKGSSTLGPHQTSVLRLRPNIFDWAPALNTYWLVEAYSTTPTALSTTSPQRWTQGRL